MKSFTCRKLNSLANMHYIYISLLNEIGTAYDFLLLKISVKQRSQNFTWVSVRERKLLR